jgi:hypothetical protein
MDSGEWEGAGEVDGSVESLVRVLEAGHGEAEEDAALRAALRLLELRAPEALVPLVRRLVRTEPGMEMYEVLINGLVAWGAEVAPATLEVLAEVRGVEARFGLFSVLSNCGARDERIYAALLELLEEEPFQGAIHLAAYGDLRALGPLGRALDAYELDDDVGDLFAQQTVLELAYAIWELGGALEGPRRTKLEHARRLRESWNQLFDRWRATVPERRRDRPGRNEPCWCGSGVKYKKCHLSEDRGRLPRGA